MIARLINAESEERIALTANTSDAINIVASGLPWSSGDHILLNEMEFPANVWPYVAVKRYGVTLEFLPCPEGSITVESIQRSLRPTTRVVALSAVQFLTGYRADLESIGALCRSRNILFIVDGIQAVGAVPVDVQRMKIDALAAGAQKWQMAPQGTGFLYLTEELQHRVQQAYVGWLSVETPWNFVDYNQPLAHSARRYEGGTLNITGLWGYHAALQLLLEIGIPAIADHILSLTEKLSMWLSQLPGAQLLSPSLREERAGIVTIGLPASLSADAVFQVLSERRVQISLREGKLRYSPHFYNSPAEMESVAELTREAIELAGRNS
jgi:selenocysteine lyase/cysteine desulfurase